MYLWEQKKFVKVKDFPTHPYDYFHSLLPSLWKVKLTTKLDLLIQPLHKIKTDFRRFVANFTLRFLLLLFRVERAITITAFCTSQWRFLPILIINWIKNSELMWQKNYSGVQQSATSLLCYHPGTVRTVPFPVVDSVNNSTALLVSWYQWLKASSISKQFSEKKPSTAFPAGGWG